jgi:DNA-binding MarR family transcriptional regulator
VALTTSGRAQLRRLHEVALRSQAEFLQTLSEPERQTLIMLLRRVLDAADRTRMPTEVRA